MDQDFKKPMKGIMGHYTSLQSDSLPFESAVSEEVDNSIDAFDGMPDGMVKEKRIDINFWVNDTYGEDIWCFRISDNGSGFNNIQSFHENFKSHTSGENAIGRFGIGAKSALISLGKNIPGNFARIVTKRYGEKAYEYFFPLCGEEIEKANPPKILDKDFPKEKHFTEIMILNIKSGYFNRPNWLEKLVTFLHNKYTYRLFKSGIKLFVNGIFVNDCTNPKTKECLCLYDLPKNEDGSVNGEDRAYLTRYYKHFGKELVDLNEITFYDGIIYIPTLIGLEHEKTHDKKFVKALFEYLKNEPEEENKFMFAGLYSVLNGVFCDVHNRHFGLDSSTFFGDRGGIGRGRACIFVDKDNSSLFDIDKYKRSINIDGPNGLFHDYKVVSVNGKPLSSLRLSKMGRKTELNEPILRNIICKLYCRLSLLYNYQSMKRDNRPYREVDMDVVENIFFKGASVKKCVEKYDEEHYQIRPAEFHTSGVESAILVSEIEKGIKQTSVSTEFRANVREYVAVDDNGNIKFTENALDYVNDSILRRIDSSLVMSGLMLEKRQEALYYFIDQTKKELEAIESIVESGV